MNHNIQTRCGCGSTNLKEISCNMIDKLSTEFILQCNDCGVRLVWYLILADYKTCEVTQ
jgi:hypothetical protein